MATLASSVRHVAWPLAAPIAPRTVGLISAGAWGLSVAFEVTGHAGAFHHHALIQGAPGSPPPPLWLAVPVFLLAWQLMIGAMMLPASVRAVGAAELVARFGGRPIVAITGFLGAYAVAWTGFGLVGFLGDVRLHDFVHATPWLAERPWLVQAASLAVAGLYQLVPSRRRALEACRHPRSLGARSTGDARVGFRLGLAHAADCLASSWALMLLMFAAGFANLAWMAILAAVMAYEALGRHGARFGIGVGVVLLGLSGVATTGVVLGF
jgi:predicted metal-binding membrane protein